MFNSISDWIKLPQQVQMPTVNMPKIPDIFGMNNKKEGEAATSNEAAADGQAPQTSQDMQQHQHQEQNQQQQQQLLQDAAKPSSGSDSEQAAANSSIPAAGDEDHEKKKKMPIDIDASKAIGQAKELGTNIGSKRVRKLQIRN